MQIVTAKIALVLASCCFMQAQTDKSLTFDAATVKPAEVPSPGSGQRILVANSGGPGSKDPGRIRYSLISLRNLLVNAYGVKNYQISGPAWLDTERYEVTATMPPETTREQFQVMLQNLLAERFRMTVHKEDRELQLYSLVVAKGGPKLKESAPLEPAPEQPAGPPQISSGPPRIGPDGFPVPQLTPGRPNTWMFMGQGRARLVATQETMDQLASFLTREMNRPVTDATGLKGKYDVTLTYAPTGASGNMMTIGGPPPGGAPLPDADAMEALPAALQSQLGLHLDMKKGPVETVVVDKAEKTPTEN